MIWPQGAGGLRGPRPGAEDDPKVGPGVRQGPYIVLCYIT